MDGVPGLTQPPITPGGSFLYEFSPPDAGTFLYHPHDNSLEQMGRGLAGALIVEDRPSHLPPIASWSGSSRTGGSTAKRRSRPASATAWKRRWPAASAIP